jgi:tetratricopeptide (TPR) repeat protein
MAMADLDLDRALEMALLASASEPEDANIMDTVAEILYRLDRTDEAVQWGSRALELDPSNSYLQGQLDRFRETHTDQ